MRKCYLVCLMIVVLSFTFSSRSNAQFVINDNAKFINSGNPTIVRLTPMLINQKGSVWCQYLLNLDTSFVITGRFNFGRYNSTGSGGADGIVFVLQNYCLNAGGDAEGIGYLGMKGQSIGVEFDTYSNATRNDPSYNHVAIEKMGDATHSTVSVPNPNDLVGPVPAKTDKSSLKDSSWYNYKFEWLAKTKTFNVYFNDTTKVFLTLTEDIKNTIFKGNPFVFWGFTSATGGSYSPNTVEIKPIKMFLKDTVTCPNYPVMVPMPNLDYELNLALDQPVKASSVNAPWTPEQAVDIDSTGSRWQALSTDINATFTVDLQDIYHVNNIRIIWEAAYASAYNILVAKDTVTPGWTTINVPAGIGGIEKTPVNLDSIRYVRFVGITKALGYGYSFHDFEVNGYSYYKWSPNIEMLTSTRTGKPIFAPSVSRDYYYTKIVKCHTPIYDTIHIHVTTPTLSFTTKNVSCKGYGDGSAEAKHLLAGTPPFSFIWDINAAKHDTTPTISNLKPGNYTVTIFDAKLNNNCSAQATVLIKEPDTLKATVVAKSDSCAEGNGKLIASGVGGTPPYFFNWTKQNSSEPTIDNLKYGTYSLIVNDTNKCVFTSEYEVKKLLCATIEPNIITPNGDHVNDAFKVKNIQGYLHTKLTVFNRWGNEVAVVNDFDISNSWDGKTKGGTELSDGVYFYILQSPELGERHGTVTIAK